MSAKDHFRKEKFEDCYDVMQELGRGQFAVVNKCISKENNQEVAAKFIKVKRSKASKNGLSKELIEREAGILFSVNHSKIIKLYGLFDIGTEIILVLELLSGGELFDIICESEDLNEVDAYSYIKQVLKAVNHIHSLNIVHLDIKPKNIVLQSKNCKKIKLIDFGLAEKLDPEKDLKKKIPTHDFVAPEIVSNETLGCYTDMWAIGVLAFILLSGCSPFLGDNKQETCETIVNVNYKFEDQLFEEIPNYVKDFISDLLIKQPALRSTAEECLKDDLFEDLKNLQDLREPVLISTAMLKQYLAEKKCKEILGEQDHVYQDFKRQVTLRETDTDIDVSPIVYSVQNVTGPAVGKIRAKVEQIVSLENISDTDKNKIDRLKQIEKEDYKPLIQQLAYKKTQEELNDLVEVLADIGYLTTKLGELSRELKYCTDAAVFYQYVITILNKKPTTENKNTFTTQELTYQHLTDIQKLIFLAIDGDQEKMPVVSEEAASNKEILAVLRRKADESMKEIEKFYRQQINAHEQKEKKKYQALYEKTARKFFEDTTNRMQKFLAKLYSDSENELGKPRPCEYAVIGLGSMALKQMTPYSDLEFAILIENEGQDKSEGSIIKQYFKNLSYLVNFKMINLGETIIPTSKYKLDMSHLVHRGVNFDLGGKTPLGRIEGDKKYELIKTIDRMLYYVRNEGDKASKIDKNLPYILEKVCYVHGNDDLVREYQDKVKKFLHSKNDQQDTVNCEARAIKLLTEQVVEFNYSEQTLSLDPKKGDLDKLQPDFSLYAEGKLFDVKQEIYRLPDRMVYNLGMYYGIDGDSAWDTIDKLKYKEVINSEAAVNLKNAVTFATTLRLKTYLHNKAQTEDISIFVKPAEPESEHKAQARQIFHLSQKDLEEHGGLFQYFYTALPLHSLLENFCMQYQTLDNIITISESSTHF
ncbi:serine/threonine-protein kinase MRCK alpha-like isoform X2 [Hydra vulgaris]|uniref:Serine/threonine-protein kinase MRCK alpha-like isoform X2 n=1 Tax=Hydra vulgaris TaxID=6087 RepID=A0ABM4DAU3_HYDVU